MVMDLIGIAIRSTLGFWMKLFHCKSKVLISSAPYKDPIISLVVVNMQIIPSERSNVYL